MMFSEDPAPPKKYKYLDLVFKMTKTTDLGLHYRLEAWVPAQFPCPVGTIYFSVDAYRPAPEGPVNEVVNIHHAHIVEEFRRQGIRTHMQSYLFKTATHVISGASSGAGLEFMKAVGYEKDEVLKIWVMTKDRWLARMSKSPSYDASKDPARFVTNGDRSRMMTR